MTRRKWFQLGAAPLASALGAAGSASLQLEIARLRLKHTWTTVMSSSEYRDNLHLTYTREGITARGEGAPIPRYQEDAASARQAVEPLRGLIEAADPWQFRKLSAEIARRLPGQYAAKAAIDIALLDWATQRLGVPLYRYLGLDPRDTPVTTFSIGIDTPEITRQKVREAAAFPVLKIKVGLATDEETIAAVRAETNKPLRVDANEGWKDKEEAVRKIRWLESEGVEFVEQPMPAGMLEEARWVRTRVHIPVIADEACLHPEDIPRIADAYDGVNIKLMKCGGIQVALRMIETARAFGLKVMLGCMIESSIGITAAAHLSPLADYADLDGNLLIANDPFRGVTVENGKLVLPDRPGLGLIPAG